MAGGALPLVVAAVLVPLSALAWTGRWRDWSRQFFVGHVAMPITLFPGYGLGCLFIGVGQYAGPARSALYGIGSLFLLAGTVLTITTPRWWGPAWYRHRDRNAPPDRSDALTDLAATGVEHGWGLGRGSAAAAARFRGEQPFAHFGATWIFGDERMKKKSALTRGGSAAGRVSLYRSGLAFAAVTREDSVRGHPLSLVIDAGDVRDARVVRHGAGSDGRERPHRGPQSLWPRLVIDTDDGSYLFEVAFAKRKSERIRAAYTQARTPA